MLGELCEGSVVLRVRVASLSLSKMLLNPIRDNLKPHGPTTCRVEGL